MGLKAVSISVKNSFTVLGSFPSLVSYHSLLFWSAHDSAIPSFIRPMTYKTLCFSVL